MCGPIDFARPPWIAMIFAALSACDPRLASAQPSPGDPPVTYEVQINGESFQVEGNQRPTKVESQLKKGTSYTLAVRIAPIQTLRLNTVQLKYGMKAKVIDDKGKDRRVAQIVHEFGFGLTLGDEGRFLDAKHQEELLKTIADDATKHYTDHGATKLTRSETKEQRFGASDGKWLRIGYTDAAGVARTTMIFVLSGKSYTVSAVVEYRDQDKDDVGPWAMNALASIEPK
jgi:hypothetical protein